MGVISHDPLKLEVNMSIRKILVVELTADQDEAMKIARRIAKDFSMFSPNIRRDINVTCIDPYLEFKLSNIKDKMGFGFYSC